MIATRGLYTSTRLQIIQLSRPQMTRISATETPRKHDLVAVIGTTGVGKSQLGVELAKSLLNRSSSPSAGEILNHDSMQCYRGLDVITNKATREEMDGVPHHLMDFLQPGREWGVVDFQRDALAKVRLYTASVPLLEYC